MDEFGTQEDVIRAIEELSDEELVKLKRHAEWKSRKTGFGQDEGYSGDALLSEACSKLLSLEKKWPKNLPFYVVLWKAIGNIANAKIQHLSGDFGDVEHKLIQYEPGDNNEVDDYLESSHSSPEMHVEARIRLEMVNDYFKNKGDNDVLKLMEAQLSGFSGPEIKDLLEIDQKQLETIQRRLSRGIDKVFEKEDE